MENGIPRWLLQKWSFRLHKWETVETLYGGSGREAIATGKQVMRDYRRWRIADCASKKAGFNTLFALTYDGSPIAR